MITASRRVELTPMLLLGAANTMLGFARTRQPDTELMLHEVGQPLGPVWDTAFVHHAGYWSHYEHDTSHSSWPLPPTNDCNDWARFAEAHGALLAAWPRAGDVFLLWSKGQKRFVHVGIVAAYRNETGIMPNGNSYMECETIEGNVDSAGKWYRDGIHRCTRRIVTERGDRIIRWSELGDHVDWTVQATPGELCRSLMFRPARREAREKTEKAA